MEPFSNTSLQAFDRISLPSKFYDISNGSGVIMSTNKHTDKPTHTQTNATENNTIGVALHSCTLPINSATEARRRLHSSSSSRLSTDRRWPSFPGHRSSYLERSCTAHHISCINGYHPQASQDPSLLFHDFTILLLCPRTDIVISDTSIVFVA